MTDLVGTTLGQYQIVELIGEGGMATVYKAWQPSLRRYVALKVLAPHLSSDTEFIQRFHQEAVSAANLKQTNIVTIHDVGTESGYHYIAMEFIEGVSLEQRIRSEHAFAPEHVVDIISQIGAALDYAHQRGFIHRDIKPANILIDASGRAVLTDFGIVKALSGSGVTSALTRAGTVFGTPHYMSPEQVRDEPLDHRCDLYALGIVCYEMLAGQVPFDGTTTHAILYAQVNNPPPPLREAWGLGVPPAVEAVVNKMLAKERANRYNNGGEFARDLAQAVSGVWPAGLGGGPAVTTPSATGTAVMGGAVVPTEVVGGMPTPTVVQPMQPAWPPTPPPVPAPARRSRWPLVLVALAAAGVVLVVGTVVGVLMLDVENPLKSIQAALDLRRAQTALDDGDYAAAADMFSQVLENEPDNVEAIEGQLETAASLAQAGQLDAAIAAYETVWQVEPGEVQALQGLGQAYEAKGEWDKATGWYERWTGVATEDGDAFLALGRAHFNLGDYPNTAVDYEQAEALGASSVEMDAHLGLAYYELARYDKAVERLQNAVGQNPEDFHLQRALGVSFYAQDQPEQALEHLNKAVALGADRSGDELMDVYYALGGCYFGQQDYEQAVGFYEQAQALDPEGEAVWADEARTNLDRAHVENAMGDVLLDLDFSNILTEGDETYAVAKTGQKAGIEGAVHLADGPWEGSQALVVEERTTNRCRRPGAESDLEIWASSDSPTIWERSSDYPFIGVYSFHFAAPGGSKARAYNAFDATEDQEYTVSVYVTKIVLGDPVFTIGRAGQDEHEIDAVEGWNTLTFTPAATDRCYFRIGRAASNTPACEVYFDAVQVEDKAYRTTYCDGSLGTGYSWSGAPHDSSSTRTATEVNLDDHASLISDNDTLSFRVVARMPYDADAMWPNTYTMLIDARGSASSDSIRLAYDSDNDRFYVSINGQRRIRAPTRTFGAGEFLEFVLSMDFGNDEHNLYIDGELVGTNTTSLTAPTLSQWKIGCNYDGRGRRAGFAFSEFSVFERALTQDEVAALYGMDLSTR